MVKYGIFFVIAVVVTYFFRDDLVSLKYEAYKDTLGALLNVSSIIFAIIGAWIAIIYPRAIGRVFSDQVIKLPEIKEADDDVNYLSELVEIVMVSAFVLMVVLSIQFLVPVAKEFIGGKLLQYGRLGIFCIVTLLTVIQLSAVFRVILANYFFLNQLRNKNNKDKIDLLHR